MITTKTSVFRQPLSYQRKKKRSFFYRSMKYKETTLQVMELLKFIWLRLRMNDACRILTLDCDAKTLERVAGYCNIVSGFDEFCY